jgi:hypothetical protein
MASNLGQCPRCLTPLSEADADSTRRCPTCCGEFVTGVDFSTAAWLNECSPLSPRPGTGSRRDPATLPCPGCGQALQAWQLADIELDRCEACRGVWLDAGETIGTEPAAGRDSRSVLTRLFVYSLTLPERVVRSTVGLAAGAAREAAGFLVPSAFQDSKTYEIVIRKSLGFLAEDIGGAKRPEAMPGTEASATSPPMNEFVARKAVGNFVDLAGLATLHVSPLWLLAIVSDVAYGSKAYVRELAEELQKQGLIDDASTIHHVDDVLEAVQHASGRAANLFDTPPLSVDELKQSLSETRAALAGADYTKVLPEAELKQYWNEMRSVSAREQVSLLGVSAAMTMQTLGKLKTVSQGTLTGLHVAGGLFNRHVLGHYAEALTTLRARGVFATLRDTSTPYVTAVWNNFAAERPTWTEKWLSLRPWKK